MSSRRTAIVLFNLGGPDRPEAVEPFLFNLFNDPAILRLPRVPRYLLAKLIARRRAPIARGIYAELGGGSPILPNTEVQAAALAAALDDLGEVACFPVMRYWHPRAAAVVRQVAAFGPSHLVMLPLYPQYSTTTTASALKEWYRELRRARLPSPPPHCLAAYPTEPGFIAELAARIRPQLEAARTAGKPRLLLSAHGLPKRIVDAGDPYQRQVEETAAAVVAALGDADLDHVVCYQSRVGPLRWIKPATVDEVKRAGRDRVPVVVAPLAFVSEHSETLVELDIELRKEAEAAGVPSYHRVATVADGPAFIAGLAGLVRALLAEPPGLYQAAGGQLEPAGPADCPGLLT